MGSFKATFFLNDHEFNVLYTKTSFQRLTTIKGKPSTAVTGGDTIVRFEAGAESVAAEAMINSQYQAIDWKIKFWQVEDQSVMKEISGVHAYITNYSETLDTTNDLQQNICLTLHSEEITVGKAYIHNEWKNNA